MRPTPRSLILATLTALTACGGGIGAKGAGVVDPDDQDGDGFTIDVDCDDEDPAVNPEAPEVCNGIDDDCDGAADLFDDDLTDAISAYADTDGDGFGDPDAPVVTCELGAGAVADATDCDDNNATTHPDAPEQCNTGADDDCDGDTNDEGAEDCIPVFADGDGDGFGGADSACYCSPTEAYPAFFEEDCDDSAAAVNPDATEVCNDGIDNDCDGTPGTCELAGSLDADDADLIVLGLTALSQAGALVAAGGDLAGDSGAELLVGAPGDGTQPSWVGAYSADFTGSIDLDQGAALASLGAGLGRVTDLAGGADIDGDGLHDVVVASGEYAGGDGAVFLWPGPVSGTVDLATGASRISGPAGAEISLVGIAGDLGGDGAVDLLVGGTDDGDVWVMEGPITGDTSPSASGQLLSGATYSLSALAGLGDVDGDGLDDFAVGASERSGTGRVWIVTGFDSTLSSLADATALIDGASSDDGLGAAIAGVGDLDADGYADLVVGAPGVDLDSRDEGTAYVLSGNITGPQDIADVATATLVGEYSNDAAGAVVAGGGDINGDGTPDLMVGSAGHDQAGSNSGITYLIYGDVSGAYELRLSDTFLVGRRSRDASATDIALVGDMNGDGFDDVATGSPGNDLNADSAGAVDVFFGAGL